MSMCRQPRLLSVPSPVQCHFPHGTSVPAQETACLPIAFRLRSARTRRLLARFALPRRVHTQ
jgi:hypothetical protein